MKKDKTYFEIDICRDCAYYGDCQEKDKFSCPTSLKSTELQNRIKQWYKSNKK